MLHACRIVLVRHAHTRENGSREARLCGRCDAPLSALGEAQVQRLRERLAAEQASAAYTSPLERAVATAAALPEALRPPAALESLQEIDCGVLDGVSLAAVQAEHPDLWQRNLAQSDDSFGWPGGESYRHFRNRVLRTVRAMAARHRGERVVLVTHAGFIAQLIGSLRGANAARWDSFRPGNASLTEVAWNCTGGAVLAFDDCGHLRGLPEH